MDPTGTDANRGCGFDAVLVVDCDCTTAPTRIRGLDLCCVGVVDTQGAWHCLRLDLPEKVARAAKSRDVTAMAVRARALGR
jgi:hypothetical protein